MSIHGYKQKKDKKNNKKKKSWFFSDDEDDYEGDDSDEQDDIEMDESTVSTTNEEDCDTVSSWWSWLFNTPAPRRSIRKPSRPKKHPKAIVIHAAQHARGTVNTYNAHALIFIGHHYYLHIRVEHHVAKVETNEGAFVHPPLCEK